MITKHLLPPPISGTKETTLGSGLRRTLCLLALFVTITTSAWAYDLVVGGVTVTSSNASGVTGTNIKAFSSGVNGGKPSVVYNNSTKTLTLWNVKIERTGSDNRAILSGISGLTVVLKGNNYLKATGASPVRFNAQTTLKCEVYNGTRSSDIIGGTQDALTVGSGATLTITDADLFLQSSNSSAFDAEGSPTLIIQNSTINAKYTGSSSSNDNYGLNNYKLLKIYDSKVTLEGYSQAIKNLTTLTLGTGMYIETPAGGSFNSTSKTVVSSTGSIAKQVVFNTGVNITNNFPDTNFRSWVSTNCDTNNDGYLLPAEISKMQVMNVSSRSIKSLTGVEFFTALTQLICNNNSLETLDVSKNTKLTNIDCGINKLSTLNLSNNKALKMIQCYHNQIRDNGVATFLSNLPTVTGGEIHFYALDSSTGNAMTAAQVAIAKGKGWTVMWQKTAGATWTEYPGSDAIVIDATNFPDDNFRSYVSSNCDPNKDGCLTPTELKDIDYIDIRTKDIKKLNGIEYFTALTVLQCNDNKLTTLDLSKNTALIGLTCENNNLSTLDLSKNTALTVIRCYRNQIHGTGATNFVTNLPRVTDGVIYFYSEELSTGNSMTAELVTTAKGKGWTVKSSNEGGEYPGSDAIAIDATNFPDETFRNWLLAQEYGKDGFLADEEIVGVKEIDVNGFVTGGTIASLKGIEHFTALTTLNCYLNQITALDVSKNTALTTLLIGSNPLKAMPDLSQNTKLTVLDCSSLGLTKLDVSKLTALTELSCGGNLLKELDLEKLTALTTLNIENNQFETLDVSHNTALTSLNCTNNRLTTIDLSNNKSLNTLFCSVNRISGTGMTALVNSLPVISWTSSSGKIYVVDETNKSEYNVCSTVQRAIATSKRWSVYHNTGLWELYEGSAVVKGDANGDGVIDANDVDALTAYILTGTLPPFVGDTDALDVDGSGTVDIVDLARLIRLTFGR